MKVLLLVAVVTICTVGLTMAAPRSKRARLLFARPDPDQDLIKILWRILERKQAAAQLEEALSQRYPLANDNLLLDSDQRKEVAKAQRWPWCVCITSPCPC